MDLDQERPGIQEGQTERTDGAERDPVKPEVIPQKQHNPRSRERQRGQLSEDDERSRQQSLFLGERLRMAGGLRPGRAALKDDDGRPRRRAHAEQLRADEPTRLSRHQ
jgi:hypothetical protein